MNAQLKFNYLDYGNTFIKNIVLENNTLYIFSDFSLKDLFLKERGVSLFENTSYFLTLEDFKDKIFVTSKIILKETKKILSLYKSLPEDLKEKLQIDSYYDIIDLADNFFKFFKDLNINMISEMRDLEEWQKLYIEDFYRMKESYDKLLERYNYLPIDWLESTEYLNLSFLEKYKKVVFIDLPHFSPLEKFVVENISQHRPVEIFLQMKEGDFNEKNLQLDKITSPEKIDLQVFKFDETIDELVNIFHLLSLKKDWEDNAIFSGEVMDNYYHRIAPKHFTRITPSVLNDTELYKFMEAQHSLLSSKEETLQAFPVEAIREALKTKGFKYFYNISSEDIKIFNSFIEEDWKYISSKIIENNDFEELPKCFIQILQDLTKIENFKDVQDFISYFHSFTFREAFKEEIYVDLFERFNQALQNALSTESLNLHGDFSEYFHGKISLSLYKLILQYMDKIELKTLDYEEPSTYILRKWNYARFNFKNSYFIGINNRTLPHIPKDHFILTESQKKNIGLLTDDNQRLIQKYRFFQGIFNSPKVIIFSPSEGSETLEASPFLEELMLQYRIKPQEPSITSTETLGILNKLFFSERFFKDSENCSSLPKENEDFLENTLKVGYYDYSLINECSYRFYLEKLCSLYPQKEEIVMDINSRFIGRFSHDVLEIIAKDYWIKFFKDGIFAPSEEEIGTYLDKFYKKNIIKIPVYLTHYFSEVILPHLRKNIYQFYRELEKNYKGQKIKKFIGEKGRYSQTPFLSQEIQVYLSGRADLVIETEDDARCIIDYKTGKGEIEQIDFYAVNLYENPQNVTGYLKNIWDSTQKNLEAKGILTPENIRENLEAFLKSSSYHEAEKKKSCNRCHFNNICRR